MINRDEWLNAIAEAGIGVTADDQGAITIKEFSELLGIGRPRAEDRMRELMDKGLAVRTTKRILRVDGASYPVPAYRLKESPNGADATRRGRSGDARRSRRERSRA